MNSSFDGMLFVRLNYLFIHSNFLSKIKRKLILYFYVIIRAMYENKK